MQALLKGRYRARIADSADDLRRAQELRHIAFRGAGAGGPGPAPRDGDAFDARCRHVLVEDLADGALMCCFRLMPLADGGAIGASYSAQFYDLSRLSGFPGPALEMGRFCLHPAHHDPDILRMAWGTVTRMVDDLGVGLLFGCSSFRGTDPAAYGAAFAALVARHLAPDRWRPARRAREVHDFLRAAPSAEAPDPSDAARQMPPLLRSYLAMGGWVSDHAVIDRAMGTLHVFTGLEIGAIPPARARLLRALAG